MGAEGACALSEALKANTTLKTLSLGGLYIKMMVPIKETTSIQTNKQTTKWAIKEHVH